MRKILISIFAIFIISSFCGCSYVEALGPDGLEKFYLIKEKQSLESKIQTQQIASGELEAENEKLSLSIEKYIAGTDELTQEKIKLNKELTDIKEEYEAAMNVGLGVTYASFMAQMYFLCKEYEDYSLVDPYRPYEIITISDGQTAVQIVMDEDDYGNFLSKYEILLEQDGLHIHAINFYIKYNDCSNEAIAEYNLTAGATGLALVLAAHSKYEVSEEAFKSYMSLLLSGISNERDIKFSEEDKGTVYFSSYEPAGDAETGSY